jgi:hypothetical protein
VNSSGDNYLVLCNLELFGRLSTLTSSWLLYDLLNSSEFDMGYFEIGLSLSGFHDGMGWNTMCD